ncbi:MAG: low molecular weight phosphotyrosine protein phosphatase [Gammaproteobacteria bacterium]|nr:low molecular weight phosphotyrosine protein phosphatase [Gammaproteobacteria bacterium]
MFNKILVVCLGNICRSPTAQFMLQQRLPNKTIHSAGITAMKHSDGKGWDMDKTARAIAEKHGHSFPVHEAQQLTRELIGNYDLVLVMENNHRNHIAQRYPEAQAKTMLLGQWLEAGGKEIPDPYKKSDEVYEHVLKLIDQATDKWSQKL